MSIPRRARRAGYRGRSSMSRRRYGRLGSINWPQAFGAAGLAVLLIVLLLLVQHKKPVGFGAVTFLVNRDSLTSSNVLDQADAPLAARVAMVAGEGGGTLNVAVGDGDQAVLLAQIDLTIKTPDGTRETDPPTIKRVVDGIVASALDKVRAYVQSTAGRPLVPLFVTAAKLQPNRQLPYFVVYAGMFLSDQDPADARKQITGMTAGQAAVSVRSALPAMPGAVVDLVYAAPASGGAQEPFNSATTKFKNNYASTIVGEMGASVGRVVDDNIPSTPFTGASAGVIPLIREYTQPGTSTSTSPAGSTVVVTEAPPTVVTTPPAVTATSTLPRVTLTRTQPPITVVVQPPAPAVMAGELFKPDSAEWVDKDTARSKMQPLADAWRAHPEAFEPLVCQGRVAATGPADGAQRTSEDRAAAGLELGRELGITKTAPPLGLSYDHPLPGYPATAPEQRAVICFLIPR